MRAVPQADAGHADVEWASGQRSGPSGLADRRLAVEDREDPTRGLAGFGECREGAGQACQRLEGGDRGEHDHAEHHRGQHRAVHGVHPDDADGRQREAGGKGTGRRPPRR